jgi:two-component system NtrC family response regulator
MSADKLLIIDDDEGIRAQLALAFSEDFTCVSAGSAQEALEVFARERPSIVLLDITLSPYEGATDGLDVLSDLLATEPGTKVIMVTGDTHTRTALEAIARGACDYYQKPINLDELRVVVRRAAHLQKLETENRRLARELAQVSPSPELWGDSPPMKEVFRLIHTVAPSDYTVLVTGESGTGKELAARAIHLQSPRRDGPFVVINCGAIPEKLLESELFGHERGAFTDAVAQKRGKFELADQGTLFLDEVGEIPTALQVKLLRFLQDQLVERLGGTSPIAVNVRIISATNRPLGKLVKEGYFREDLFYRISVINITLPPLRERGDDILLLARAFLSSAAALQNRPRLTLSPLALEAIRRYKWPGNVRELENRIRRAALLAGAESVGPADLGFGARAETEDEGDDLLDLAAIRDEAERRAIMQSLARHDGNVSRVARRLGVSRTTLYGLMRKHGIETDR